ncbi:MAG: glycosyltransferase family 4 protein [Sulfuricella sp.]|nr:glycosyltransferase family 4 protein [Sulfuricella sp.]
MQFAAPKLLFLVTEDWYFCSHRLPLACAARDAGFEVAVACRVREHGERILAAGLKLIPIQLQRSSHNPWRELAAIGEIAAIYRRERPTLVHHVALKPVLYGSLAAKIAGIPGVINALAGMGYVFTSSKIPARLLRPFVTLAFRLLLGRGRIILQNPDDRAALLNSGVAKAAQISLIRGSGVDTRHFAFSAEPDHQPPVIVLPARMLGDKGVGEFVAAAQALKARGIAARFLLIGERDPDNPAAIPVAQLEEWHASGIVEWLGRRNDMEQQLAQANIVCLPSYREGLPKALLEAAACGRAIVATDVPGCREIVRDEYNGLLVPARNAEALANALRRLIENPDQRREFGRRGREMVEQEFSVEKITAETLALYRELLA